MQPTLKSKPTPNLYMPPNLITKIHLKSFKFFQRRVEVDLGVKWGDFGRNAWLGLDGSQIGFGQALEHS